MDLTHLAAEADPLQAAAVVAHLVVVVTHRATMADRRLDKRSTRRTSRTRLRTDLPPRGELSPILRVGFA